MVDTPGIRHSGTPSTLADVTLPSKADAKNGQKPDVAAPSAQGASSAGAKLNHLASMKPPESSARPTFSARPSVDGERPAFTPRPTLEGAAQVSGPQPGAHVSDTLSRLAGQMRSSLPSSMHSGIRPPGLLGAAADRANLLTNRLRRPVGAPPGMSPHAPQMPYGSPVGSRPPVAPVQPSPLESALMTAGNFAPMAGGMVSAGAQVVGAAMQAMQSITMAIAELLKNGAKNVEEASKG
jgi:hypothetical protein